MRFLLCTLIFLLPTFGRAEIVRVQDLAALSKAISRATPGTRIEIAAGEYPKGLYLKGVQGTKEKPIVISGADREHPPVFHGSIQFSSPAWLEIQDLKFAGIQKNNGLHIDDTGNPATPAHHITMRRIGILDIGPIGNWDGIKISGLEDFLIVDCQFENWGAMEGSGIDSVGCQRGVIENCVFRHAADPKLTGHDAIQMKGGSREIVVRRNRFEHAGARGINIGGGTGLQFFRPPLASLPPGELAAEAKSITVEDNLFIGSVAPICFATADGATVRHNTFYLPERYLLRILQEAKEPNFVACRGGNISDNLIVFRSGTWSDACNIGGRTAPETFTFSGNWWYCQNAPTRSRPKLPTAETGGVYGQDPQLDDQLRPKPGSPAAGYGVRQN